jgi:hypothetical protein
MCSAKGHVRFAPDSDRKSGHAANDHVCFTPESGRVRRKPLCLLWAKSGREAATVNLSRVVPIGAHQHAPHFKCAAAAALESEKVAQVTFSLDPEQSHFEIAFRAYDER